MCKGRGTRCKCRCDISKTTLMLLLPLGLKDCWLKCHTHPDSLSLCPSAPGWSEPVLSCLVWSSPVVPYLETLWSADLTAYLFTELFDMHVCFYRFPSMLLCVGHTAPHVTEETEQLDWWKLDSVLWRPLSTRTLQWRKCVEGWLCPCLRCTYINKRKSKLRSWIGISTIIGSMVIRGENYIVLPFKN